MRKWEYLYLVLNSNEKVFLGEQHISPGRLEIHPAQLDNVLARLGSEGWELAGIDNTNRVITDYIFKRPISNI